MLTRQVSCWDIEAKQVLARFTGLLSAPSALPLTPRADAEAQVKSGFKNHRPFGDSDERPAPTSNTCNLTCGFQRLWSLLMYRGVRGAKRKTPKQRHSPVHSFQNLPTGAGAEGRGISGQTEPQSLRNGERVVRAGDQTGNRQQTFS